MKLQTLCITIFLTLVHFTSHAQFEGKWSGTIETPIGSLELIFNIVNDNGKYSGNLEVPQQTRLSIPLSEITTLEVNIIDIKIPMIGAQFKGRLLNNTIVGNFKQNGMSFDLNLIPYQDKLIKRPQEPKGPFAYKVENFEIEQTKEKFKLAGTLTLPNHNSKHPLIILINGSGQQNRDSEIFEHKPFLLWADELTKIGFAVARMDDRQVGGSGGNLLNVTSYDFADDVISVLEHLKTRNDIDPNRISLMGHSEGGMIASIVASKRKDIHSLVLLAAPIRKGSDVLADQNEDILTAQNIPASIIESNRATNEKIYELAIQSQGSNFNSFDEFINKTLVNQGLNSDQINTLLKEYEVFKTPWMRTFLMFENFNYLSQLKIPILAINGDKDLQVNGIKNLSKLKELDPKGKRITTHLFKDKNHLFQSCKTGLVSEYGKIKETISPDVIDYVKLWLTTTHELQNK